MNSGFQRFDSTKLTNSDRLADALTSENAAESRTNNSAGIAPNRDSTLGQVLPAGACDCHAHVYGPFETFPLPTAPPFTPPIASIQALEKLWERFAIQRGVIVQGGAYREDHGALLAAIRRAPENRRGVALVGRDTSDAALDELNESGVKGARLNFVRHLGNGFDIVRSWQLVRRIEPFGWHLELHIDAEDLERLQEFVQESPVNIVIDHMGRIDATMGLSQAPFQALLKLIGEERCWVKLSGADRLAKRGALKDAIAFARSLLQVAPDRVVWGTDWPHVNLEQSYGDEALFRLLTQIAPDNFSLKRLLVDNPARLYGFNPDPIRTSDPQITRIPQISFKPDGGTSMNEAG
jgi:2-pyrone-4,6-dicarboxylate lactonase